MLSGGVNPYNRDLFASNGYQGLTVDSGSKWVDIDESLIDISAYGVSWDENTNGVSARTEFLSGHMIDGSLGNVLLPIHASMRCCVVNDAGEVAYFLDANNRELKEDGVTPSVLDGTDGQVMLYIPKFYSKYNYIGTTHTWAVAPTQLSGFETDPAFKIGAQEADYILVGTYPGYIDGGGKLCSVSGVLPTVSKTRTQFRAAAALRGTGWHQYDAAAHGLLQRLFFIEYADLNAKAMLGMGLTQYVAWPGMPQALTGVSNAFGNASGGVSAAVPQWAAATAKVVGNEVIPNTVNNYTYRCTIAGTTGASEPTWPTTIGLTVTDGGVTWECVRSLQHVTFRGIEHFFGQCLCFLDGLNVHNSTANRSRVYYADDPSAYADDTDVGYELVGLAAELDGYGGKPIIDGRLIYPRDTTGSSIIRLCDYYYTYFNDNPDIGWRVVLVGGNAANGVYAGPSCWNSHNGVAITSSNFGGRLCFRGGGL